MRVCMFAMLLPVHVTGGMEIHSLDLARGIAKAGHEVVIITSRHPKGMTEETVDGVEIHYCDIAPTSRKPMGLKSLDMLRRLNLKRRFDVLHSQSFAASYYVKTGLKRDLKIPLVTTMHGTASSEIRSNLGQGPSLMLLPKILFHTFNHRFRTVEMVRESDAVIAISDELRQTIPKEFGISPDKVRTVYNGVDTNVFRPDESMVRLQFPGKKIVLSVSVLHRQKGIQYLIEAFKAVLVRVSNAHLVVVGDGGYRGELEALAERLGLKDNVSFKGRIPNAQLKDYYNAADAFVIPTIRVEGLPLVELESMACGKPVIASDIGGIPSVIIDGVNGLLVKPADVKGLADKITSVLEDGGLASRLGAAARKTIEERFSKDRMVQETLKVYESVIG